MVKPFWSLLACSALVASSFPLRAGENCLENPAFDELARASGEIPHWSRTSDSEGEVKLAPGGHSGQACLRLAGGTAVEQRIGHIPAGAYLLRCWIKSEAEQAVTVVLEDPTHAAASYTYADLKVPKGPWTQVQAFCVVEVDGPLTVRLGGMSSEFRRYHGGTSEMRAPIQVDDCELVRFEHTPGSPVVVWDSGKRLGTALNWRAKGEWSPIMEPAHAFTGAAVFQDELVAGAVREEDGALALYAIAGQDLAPRAVLRPEPPLNRAKTRLVRELDKTGIRVESDGSPGSYTAWLMPKGVVTIEADHLAHFQVKDCQLRYGLLPSFVGTDLCYAPQELSGSSEVRLPSSQWFVGLRDGHDSMLVAAWSSAAQKAALSFSGTGKSRMIDTLSISTDGGSFSVAWVEHAHVWAEQSLNEDWLGEYVTLPWQPPFPARWMGNFFVSAGPKPSFRTPFMSYSFPVAQAKTRMWGVWFEDWNHYPFFLDGPRLTAHFEKSFVPTGQALFYFLEPAAADLWSPCEIAEQVLGKEKAGTLFDFDANHLRKLRYSTPDEFIYDRPVCATTTKLSGIKQQEKPTVGVNLATHLFEFIREIRGRVDQYLAFFDQTHAYLEAQERAHPETHAYIAELEALVAEARAKGQEIHKVPLSAVEAKIDSMKQQLRAGKGDGFDCGNLDVRPTAGAQDDLCRRYNRLVLRLSQTAALKCGDSPAQAAIASHIWEQSRAVLRQPTRWEPRRTLYFFEP